MRIQTTHILTCFLFLSVSFAISEAEYPKTSISNDHLYVDIYLPDAEKGYYRGTRFEWSGLVQEVIHKGHRFFGDWKTTHDPTNHDDANGIASEFSMGLFGVDPPLNYEDAEEGESFLKIGIGLLEKKEEERYSPFARYNIQKAFDWNVTQGTDWIQFEQEIEPFLGWAYRYTKRISLTPDNPNMVVSHSLTNSGTRQLKTTQYCHNFITIDQEPINENYQLVLPFPIRANRNFGKYAKTNNTRIVIENEIIDKTLFSEIAGFSSGKDHNRFLVANTKTDTHIEMTGSQPLLTFNFFASRYAICPEPFVGIQLEPGETFEWQNQYSFSAERDITNNRMEWPLDSVIDGDFNTPKMALNDFLSQIYFKTNVKFTIDEGIEAFVQAELSGNPTVKDVLEAALKDSGLLYKKSHSGVVRIYKIDSE